MKKYTYILILVFLFVIMPIFKDFSGFEAAAKNSTSMWNIEYPENIPEDIHIKIEPGFVYAAGIPKQKFKTPNSFKISTYRTGVTSYALDMNEAFIVVDNKQYRILQPICYNYLYNGEKLPQITIFKGVHYTYDYYIAPLENIYYSKLVNNYTEAVKSYLIGAYTVPIKFNHKNSILKDKTSCIISIPLKNNDTFKTTNLVFKITF